MIQRLLTFMFFGLVFWQLLQVSTCLSELVKKLEEPSNVVPTSFRPEIVPIVQKELSIPAVVNKVRASVVTLKVYTGRGRPSVGSGVIIDKNRLVTCRHVVGSIRGAEIILDDGTKLTGHVEFADEKNDLALLSFESDKNLPALQMEERPVGFAQSIVTMGSPYGYSGTVAVGVISSTKRSINMPSGITLEPVIQHSAALNVGGSGGPVLDLEGNVIGLNVAVRADAQGVGFALPMGTVCRFLRGK